MFYKYSDKELLEAANRDPSLATLGQVTKLKEAFLDSDSEDIEFWNKITDPDLTQKEAMSLITKLCGRDRRRPFIAPKAKSAKQKIADHYIDKYRRDQEQRAKIASYLDLPHSQEITDY